MYGVNQAILAWSFKKKSTGKRPSQYCLIHYIQLQLYVVNQAILAWSFKKIYWQMTRPILLDSLYTAAVICSESSNIGLVV
jgi:hypothetical protein